MLYFKYRPKVRAVKYICSMGEAVDLVSKCLFSFYTSDKMNKKRHIC